LAGKNCIICGYYSSRPFCPACEDRANRYFEIICQYLKDNPRPTVIDVYGDTFIPLPVIYGLKDIGWIDIVPSDGQYILTSAGEQFNSRLREIRR